MDALSEIHLLNQKVANFEHLVRDYARDWSAAGPIIVREAIELKPTSRDTWTAIIRHKDFAFGGVGETPLIAAMRAFCSSRG